MFERLLGMPGVALVAAGLAAPVTAEPMPKVGIVVVSDPGGKAVVVAGSDASGRFGARVSLPEGVFVISTFCGDGPCAPARLARLTVNGKRIPTANALRIDTRANPALRNLTIGGLVERGSDRPVVFKLDAFPSGICCKVEAISGVPIAIKFDAVSISKESGLRLADIAMSGGGQADHGDGGAGSSGGGGGAAGGGGAGGAGGKP